MGDNVINHGYHVNDVSMACVLAATFLLNEMLTKSAKKAYQIPNVGKRS